MHPVPLYHCFGMVMGCLAATSHGACIVLPAPAFDPEASLAAVQAQIALQKKALDFFTGTITP